MLLLPEVLVLHDGVGSDDGQDDDGEADDDVEHPDSLECWPLESGGTTVEK